MMNATSNVTATNTTNGNGMTVSDMIQMVMYLDDLMGEGQWRTSPTCYKYGEYERIRAQYNSARIERGYYLRAIEAECESA